MSLAVGTRLGPYEVVAPLGAGGMGEVYRARDTRLGRDVAIKVLAPDAVGSEDRRHRFAREARAASTLSHPNIATVYDVGESDGVSFIAMEYVEGQTLDARIGGHPLATDVVVALALQAAEALDEAHGRGITHRDIKPGNLMVTPRGRIKVLDFGLARLERRDTPREETTLTTRDGMALGTLPYMSPEQALGREVDGRSDLFSLGAVIYEMATGRRPFGGESGAEVVDRILHGEPSAIARINDTAPPELERIVRKCLEKDRERRYQSARDLAVDLDNLKRDLERGATDIAPVLPPTAPPASAAAPSVRQAPWWRWPAVAAVVAGIGGTVWLAVSLRPGSQAAAGARIASLAVLPLENMTGDAAQEYFADGMTEALITELARIDPRSLKVISRTSVMRFKKTAEALPEIARQLGVEGIVTGSVMRSGNRVRVTATLLRASTEEQLWAERFDRDEENVLTLDSEVALAIAGQVRVAVSPEQANRPRARQKVKPEAYDLVLQGTHLVKTGGSPDALHRAIALFEKAVAIDPQSVEAHAGLANALSTLAGYGFAKYWDLYPRIRKEVDTALALDSTYSWAQVARGDLSWAERNPRGQLEAYRRAVELDPSNSTALYGYGFSLDTLESGPEGEKLIRKAIEIDPLAQAPRCGLMTKLYAQRRYGEAEAEARKILDLDPNWFWAWDSLWRIHVQQGKLAEAQEESRKSWTVVFGEDFKPPSGLDWENYERWLDRFLESQTRAFGPGFLAASYARRGEKQTALNYLETAAASNDVFMGQLDFPDFDSIRAEPRFRKVVEGRRLPEATFCRVPAAESRRQR